MTDAREKLEAAEDRLRRLANDCAMVQADPGGSHLHTERTANMVEDTLDDVRAALDAMPEGPDSGWIDAGTRESVSAPHDTHGPGVYRASVGYVETPALGNYRIWLKPEEDAE